MKPDEFDLIREKAVEIFESQPAKKPKISLDAIFLALATPKAATIKARPATQGDEPPEWFTKTLAKIRKSKEHLTAGQFLIRAGQFPADRKDSLNVARWLRDAGVKSRKTGGNMIFEIE